MQKLTIEEQEIFFKKWTFKILFMLSDEKKYSYRKIKAVISIPNSTFTIRLKELVKYKLIEKYVYGNISMPHYTDYKITKFGLDYINNQLQ